MIYRGPEISTYWGDEQYSDRKANVMKNSEGFYVEMYKGDQLVEKRPLYDHSQVYAENCAENWCQGFW